MSENSRFQRSRLAVAVGAALSLGSAQVYAAEGAGRVLSTRGSVFAVTEDGSTRALSQGGHVYSGDIIETREGRVQIRFHDGGLVSLKPETRFEIEEYVTDADGEGGNAAMRLLKGAMRTITGAIDGEGDDEYSVETPVATIGIRGTQYALTLCDTGRCGDDVDEGLYGQVVSNRITVRNEAGQGSFSSGSWFQVPNGNTRPKRILQPAGVIFRGDAAAEDEADEVAREGRTPGGGGDGVVHQVLDQNLEDVDNFTERFSQSTETGKNLADTVLANAAVGVSVVGNRAVTSFPVCVSDAVCGAGIDEDGNLRRFGFDGGTSVNATSGVSLVESGSISSLDATWGRWQGEIEVNDGGGTRTVTGSMPWAYSTNPTSPSELTNRFNQGGSGQIFFDLGDGPSPVGDVNGTNWQVNTLSVVVDYNGGTGIVGNGNVQLGLDQGISVVDLQNASDAATIDPTKGDQGFSVALESTSGSFNDEGELSAIFAGDNADGLIVDFNVEDVSEEEVIKGVKILDPAT
jgi:hypothetical protein